MIDFFYRPLSVGCNISDCLYPICCNIEQMRDYYTQYYDLIFVLNFPFRNTYLAGSEKWMIAKCVFTIMLVDDECHSFASTQWNKVEYEFAPICVLKLSHIEVEQIHFRIHIIESNSFTIRESSSRISKTGWIQLGKVFCCIDSSR